MYANLCLGTAQFGQNYGITNNKGIISNNELEKIFKSIQEKEIKFLDTANEYGNSEKIIGNNLIRKEIKVITKFKTGVKKLFKKEDINTLELGFQETLRRLNKKNIDSYLLHDPREFTKGNNDLLLNWLNNLKERGLIKRIGVSIYEESDLDHIPLKKIEVIQFPLSVYDQRLLKEDIISKLKENNISIHVRSIFLQGLLLEKSSRWPKFINKSFLNHHIYYQKKVLQNNLSLLESAISFIKRLDFPELILFGVTSLSELESFYKIWKSEKILDNNLNFNLFKWDNIDDIDPRRWSKN
tara:strand:- start:212 stop:1105 length:894 start_codon:yes stop_codon:yes gene_type:complete